MEKLQQSRPAHRTMVAWLAWIVVALCVAACMPVMPEGTPAPDTTSTPALTEEATTEATEEATEEPAEEPTAAATEEPTEEAGAAGAAGMEIAAQLQEGLASELQINPTEVEIVQVEAVEWPDACLGVYAPDVMCAQVITPGYLVVLAVAGQQYEYHTNSDGSSVQVAAAPDMGMDQGELGEGVAFVWYREGGIAGFCDILTAYVSGELEAATCYSDPPQVTGTRAMSVEESEQLRTWLAEYAPFTYHHDDGNVDDGMTIQLRFAGEGETVPDDVQQEEIVLTAQEWHASISQ